MSHKDIYEALQAVNARLDETGEQLLVDLVEKIRTGLRQEREGHTVYLNGGPTEETLKIWIEVDAAEPVLGQPAWHDMRLPWTGESGRVIGKIL